jgi:hypothetical protein
VLLAIVELNHFFNNTQNNMFCKIVCGSVFHVASVHATAALHAIVSVKTQE